WSRRRTSSPPGDRGSCGPRPRRSTGGSGPRSGRRASPTTRAVCSPRPSRPRWCSSERPRYQLLDDPPPPKLPPPPEKPPPPPPPAGAPPGGGGGPRGRARPDPGARGLEPAAQERKGGDPGPAGDDAPVGREGGAREGDVEGDEEEVEEPAGEAGRHDRNAG